MKNKISVFGVGFIGSNYCRMFPDDVIPIESGDTNPKSSDVLYMRSTTDNYNVFSDVHLDINVNLNGLMDVLPNVTGTINYVSSWFVYASPKTNIQSPVDENSPCHPNGMYSICKLTAEMLTRSYCETFNKKYRIMRLCNVIGGDNGAGKKKNAFEFLLGKIKKNEDIDVYIGNNYRNYMHVEDVCRAMRLIMERGKQDEIYNIGFRESYRLEDLLTYAIKVSGSTSKINHVEAPAFHKIVQAESFFMKCDKLYKLGFLPHYSPFEAISKIISG